MTTQANYIDIQTSKNLI